MQEKGSVLLQYQKQHQNVRENRGVGVEAVAGARAEPGKADVAEEVAARQGKPPNARAKAEAEVAEAEAEAEARQEVEAEAEAEASHEELFGVENL